MRNEVPPSLYLEEPMTVKFNESFSWQVRDNYNLTPSFPFFIVKSKVSEAIETTKKSLLDPQR